VDFVLATLALGVIENALSFVVFGTVAFSVLMCVLFATTRGESSMYDQIGQGGFSREGDQPKSGTLTPVPGSPAASAEQEREIRQMLHARSERMVRRGEPALDIDAELARLLTPAHTPGKHSDDAELAEEVRQLVIARNERRIRQGLEPLDEDAEVTRTLAEMDP
jgi:hypothetical protein